VRSKPILFGGLCKIISTENMSKEIPLFFGRGQLVAFPQTPAEQVPFLQIRLINLKYNIDCFGGSQKINQTECIAENSLFA
jgi:hypothetical protein